MIPVTTMKGKRVALFGLGGSGMATAHALLAGGAELTAFDDNPESAAKAEKEGIPTADLRGIDLDAGDALVVAPGVPLTHPKPHWSVELAKAAGIAVIGDIELFARERRANAPGSPFIAITGTNGKSTTTALISHILRAAGRDVQMGGNIGTAILSLEPPAPDRIHVVECSSYQIDLAPTLDPSIGVLLNLAPDHLDRHGTMDAYAAIKQRLVAAAGVAVIGMDDHYCAQMAGSLEAAGREVVRISGRDRLKKGVYCEGRKLVHATGTSASTVADLDSSVALRGEHNAQNAAAAWAVCRQTGLSVEEVQNGFDSFAGLAHRMEQVAIAGKIVFINDSKATNADAAARALASFERIYWIAGGLAKDGGIEALAPWFGRVARAYLVGEAAPQFAATLGGRVEYEISGTVGAAVRNAARDAGADVHDEPAVLLSPACASFDQFANFEKRGEAFREAVLELEGVTPMRVAAA